MTATRDHDVRSGKFRRTVGVRLKGKTLGLVGLGRIGRALAWRAAGLGPERDRLRPVRRSRLLRRASDQVFAIWKQLLATADIVSLHLPGTDGDEDTS